jgi:hypothetical protein
MADAPVMVPKVPLLSVPAGALRLTILKTFVASPRNWNLMRPWIVKSRKIDASTSRYPGESNELTLTVPSRREGPAPAGHPTAPFLQYA